MEGNKILNILLTDDDQDDRFFFQKGLDTLEFPSYLKTVRDGEQLMNYLDKHSDSLPDMLFLDLNMPKKNGSECLTEIKKSDKLKHLPVIIYSTSKNNTIADVINQGAHNYIRKCDFEQLQLQLQKVLTEMIANSMGPSRAIHIGKKIKEELNLQEISVIDFAKQIKKSRNVIYDIFERESIDTDLLYNICKVLKCDFFSLYSAQKVLASESVKHFHGNGNNIGYFAEQVTIVLEKNPSLEKEILSLNNSVKPLESKRVKLKK